ncbi:MAG: glucose-1-phosphate thymidylyltransferase, partial [Nitrososphaerales archaeon]
LTATGNKHMIPIANQPILFYGLQQLARVKVHEVGIVLGPIQEGIRDAVGDGSRFGLSVTYIEQGPPKGLAHAVQCAASYLGEDPFIMYLGDNLLEKGLDPFVEAFREANADAVLGVTPVSDPHRFGVIEVSGSKVISIEEKPRRPKSNLALVGVYVFSPRIHPVIDWLQKSPRGELEITDAIQAMVDADFRVVFQRVYGWWKDTGAPDDLLEANDLVLNSMNPDQFQRLGSVDVHARVVGPVAIGPDSVVEADATIEGPVVIGSNARIASGTTIGPGTSIGSQVELRGCSIRRSIVLDGTKVWGAIRLHDSLIGRNADVQGHGPKDREISLVIGDTSRIRF